MKVTIGLPVFNAAAYIEDAINSIKAQTFDDWECIIIDDGSNDNSIEIIEKNIDDRFTFISDGRNLGLIERLNQISGLSNGEYIARMDSDDIMHPQRLERQVSYLNERGGIDVVGSSAYLIDTENNIYGIRDAAHDFDFKRIVSGSPFIHPSIMGRRDWFVKYKYSSDAERIEDYELWLRTFKFSCFANISEPLIYYREAGLPYLKKYLQTSSGMREVVSRYKTREGASFITYKFIAVSIVKEAIFILLCYYGKEDKLMRARARKMNMLEYLDAFMNFRRATGHR